jgi:D-glycero-alpha-D-manno-heptose-7-phosphate kinase
LIHLLSTFKGAELSSEELARIACKVEIELCGEPIGKQDQYASAFGGLNRFRFNSDESVDCIRWDLENRVAFLNESLLLYHTGIGRSASTILKEQASRIDNDPDAIHRVRKIRDRVDDTVSCILLEDSESLGALLSESWNDKQQLATGISNNDIDQLLESAISCGASGGKLVGAGGGGFLLLCVDPAYRKMFQEKFTGLRNLPFLLDNVGSAIVYNDEVKL